MSTKITIIIKWLAMIGFVAITIIIVCISIWVLSYFQVPKINSTVDSLLQSPQVEPLVISTYTDYIQLNRDRDICISISQRNMATNFEAGDVVERHIVTNTRLLIDKEVIPFWDLNVSMTLLAIDVMDSSGNTVGSYGSPVSFCTKRDLEVGLHMATVVTKNMRGEDIIYSWIIKIVP